MAKSGAELSKTLTQARVREMLDYDPSDGMLRWRHRDRAEFSTTLSRAAWTAQRAGREAGHVHHEGYRVIQLNIDGVKVFLSAHRLIWLHVHGVWPQQEIDHINRIRTDNRLVNLRDVPNHVNRANRSLVNRSGQIGLGVSQIRTNGRWRAYININGKPKHLGCFPTKADAMSARLKALPL